MIWKSMPSAPTPMGGNRFSEEIMLKTKSIKP
jgi:hypothetical protein